MVNLKRLSRQALIHVVADHREADGAAVANLQLMSNIDFHFAQLEAGDYLIDDRLLFERKTLLDFTESVKDGRLFRQALALVNLEGSIRGALILEGTAADLARSGMRREALQGALITVSLFFGLPVLRAADGAETARLMVYAARQAREIASGALPRRGRRPKGKRKTQLAILQSLPGVGPERAERLLQTFGSVEAVFAADQQSLERIPGLGARTAKAIRWAVEEEQAPYRPNLSRRKHQNAE
jgi:ERCC4-type nuclease